MIAGEMLLAAACLLLVAAAGPKIVDPVPAALLLRDAGIAAGRGAARAVGVVEAAAGATGLVVTNPWVAGGVAILYLGFAVVLTSAMRRGSDRPCGCFGAGGAAPRFRHVAVDGLVAAAVALSALGGVRSAWDATVVRGAWFPVVAVAVAVAVVAFTRAGGHRPT